MIKVKCKDCGMIVDAKVHGIYISHVYVAMERHAECSLVGWGASWNDILSSKEAVEASAFFYRLVYPDLVYTGLNDNFRYDEDKNYGTSR